VSKWCEATARFGCCADARGFGRAVEQANDGVGLLGGGAGKDADARA